jgi:hypothetical protein
MNLRAASPSRIRVSQAAVCLLLGLLFLYNPFFTVHEVPGNIQVCHPPSYRATVASSELRRCTIDPAEPLIPATGALTILPIEVTAPACAVPTSLRAAQPEDDVSPFPQEIVVAGLWFRPPPVLAN